MKNIELIKQFELGKIPKSAKNKDAAKIFDSTRRQMIEVILQNGEVLPKHKAREPITVFCLAGNGVFRAGKDLEEEQKLVAGTLITLEAEIEHEVIAEPEMHILVTKFKEV
jgi:quercetin dioxygenase-like cupin family protein